MRLGWMVAILSCGLWTTAQAQTITDPPGLGDEIEPDCAAHVQTERPTATVAGERPAPSPPAAPGPPVEPPAPTVERSLPAPPVEPPSPTLPGGRAIASLDRASCFALLREADVTFVEVPAEDADGVELPIRLSGPIAGLRVASRGHSVVHEILDCRLAVAILAWSDTLRSYEVTELLHYSTYRPGARVGGSGRPSAHAAGLAMDLAVVGFEDGQELDVLDAWTPRERGAPPCEGEGVLRALVCAAVERDLFQVVLTPHHDRAHENHVHLELRADVEWSFIR